MAFLENVDRQHEEKVRRRWLISLFLITAITLLVNTLDSLDEELLRSSSPVYDYTILLADSIIATLLWFWITYHCAYKKRGTAWLMWTMITMPLVELALLYRDHWNQLVVWNLEGWAFGAVVLGFEIFFWVNCLRLYRVNAANKRREPSAL